MSFPLARFQELVGNPNMWVLKLWLQVLFNKTNPLQAKKNLQIKPKDAKQHPERIQIDPNSQTKEPPKQISQKDQSTQSSLGVKALPSSCQTLCCPTRHLPRRGASTCPDSALVTWQGNNELEILGKYMKLETIVICWNTITSGSSGQKTLSAHDSKLALWIAIDHVS